MQLRTGPVVRKTFLFLFHLLVFLADAQKTSSGVAAKAPEPSVSDLKFTAIMAAHGCKMFADTLLANKEAVETYQDNVEGGLTVFCPLDESFKAFLPELKNLTAAEKESFLEFFGVPIYQSLSMLQSNNGQMNTLATNGANTFDFTVQNDGQDVTLKTALATAKIKGTLMDKRPLAIYTIDKVLMPKELFKGAPTPAPAPAPEKVADAPKALKDVDAPGTPSNQPAASPDEHLADQKAHGNGAARLDSARYGSVILGLCIRTLIF